MTISYHELWFLERCIDLNATLAFVHLPEDEENRECGFSGFWNRRIHGLTVEGIAETLWSLYQKDAIKFDCHSIHDEERFPFNPVCAGEITTLIREESECYSRNNFRTGKYHWYSVAASGVRLWEEYARPNWSRYTDGVSAGYHDEGRGYLQIVATSKHRARSCLIHESRDPQDLRSLIRINWKTETVEKLIPWEPFPGVRLPRGVSISVDYMRYPYCDRIPSDTPVSLKKSAIDSFWRQRKRLYQWYKHSVDDHPARPHRGR